MLSFLKIDNLALIRHVEVEFGPGLNVVTGETGAGKSILLGAISLLLGRRADRTVIRQGAERCEIGGLFQLKRAAADELAPLLQKLDIPFDPVAGELAIRRVIGENSGRCYVNDSMVTAKTLQELGEHLIDVHTANEHQSLTSKARQLELLDRFAGTEEEAAACARLCAELAQLRREAAGFDATLPSPAEASHLALVLEEIEKADPQMNEDEELTVRHDLAANSRQIVAVTAELQTLLADGEATIPEQLALVYRKLQELARFDADRIGELATQCEVISEQVGELAGAIRDFGDGVELDEAEFLELENRLSTLYTLKRRYGPTLEQVLQTLDEARRRLDDYRRGDERRAEFKRRDAELVRELRQAADALSARRRQQAERLLEKVTEKLRILGFPSGQLAAEFATLPEPGPNGQDALELLFSANAGEPLLPLRKIASSGELSRLMLALKTVLADADRVPVAVFDEIDVNIGGETAGIVAAELHKLGKQRQLLAISHLPQLAARGDRHYLVRKQSDRQRTTATVEALTPAGRRQELARMLGGGPAALKHAGEILKKK